MHYTTLPDNIKLNLPSKLENIALYMWYIFCESTGAWASISEKDFHFTIESSGCFPISSTFELLLEKKFDRIADKYNLPEGLDNFADEDPVACCFYLINSIHETLLPEEQRDRFGRYPYEESIQHANKIIEINYCQEIFNKLYYQIFQKKIQKSRSRIFWSHDIDYLYSAWKTGILKAIKSGKYSGVPQHIINGMFNKHDWDNIEQILQIEKRFGIRSVFFFLTEQGKYQNGNASIDHSDYKLQNPGIRKKLRKIIDSGSQIGLHKSAYPSIYSEEMQKFPFPVEGNRNHFLKFSVPDYHYQQIEKSGLHYDASLGFAEHYGFRNSFGRPFRPYNLIKNKPYSFIEYPLHLMDATFTDYLNDSIENMLIKMQTWIASNKDQSIISILLHNSRINLKDVNQKSAWISFYNSIGKLQLPSFLP